MGGFLTPILHGARRAAGMNRLQVIEKEREINIDDV
jgi:hypothetical protein